ncbi:glycosyltransferase involved in cell wall biosynthesis [Cryobacterium mesophilum]|uniref:Glycosyltransferase n=1 Tax=Terrimesophilobacter mesophilus TaxID=433647 RepID=A0A4R8VAW7_9MICO|nr:glycosyltransferase family 2 protein [Terrimesophilobacter mesophilus]MBB5632405.1 glycosyltransferase involved in cell wall biosynthesis [Terrimesophilobacter mesophilus]TFB79240.1 glycosyltransferase [Terrimesophilobacter mesophilus]
MPPATPTVSIVIPAYNEEASIRACVMAAIMQTTAASEIIVVDNRSTDATGEIVRALQVEYPDSPLIYFQQDLEQGLVPTRNFGLDRAQGTVIGRIDADSVIEPNWVAEVQQAFIDESVAAATGPVLYYDMPLRRFGLKADDRVRRFILTLSRDYHFLFGSNMAIRRTAWLAIRDQTCRDEVDELHEDIDLSIHLAQNGLKVTYVTSMVSGMSARRLEDSPRDYSYYVHRFERTYARHGLMNPVLRVPMWVFFAIYPLGKVIRTMQHRKLARAA